MPHAPASNLYEVRLPTFATNTYRLIVVCRCGKTTYLFNGRPHRYDCEHVEKDPLLAPLLALADLGQISSDWHLVSDVFG